MMYSKLRKTFEENNGILTTKMARKYGLNDLELRNAVGKNHIQKYSSGIYFLDN